MTITTVDAPTPARRPRLRDGWVLGSLVVLGSLLLVFVPFTRGDWGTRVCVPALSAWAVGPPEPSTADRATFSAFLTRGDLETKAAIDRVVEYEEWRAGAGACRADSRERMTAAAVALGVGLALIVAVRWLTRRTAGGARPPRQAGHQSALTGRGGTLRGGR